MLERATACLDWGFSRAGSISHRLPASRRLLHSSFWHAACPDYDPAEQTLAVLHKISSNRRLDTSRRSKPTELLASAGPHLDFLYPPQLLAYLKRLALTSTAEIIDRRSYSATVKARDQSYSPNTKAARITSSRDAATSSERMEQRRGSSLIRLIPHERHSSDKVLKPSGLPQRQVADRPWLIPPEDIPDRGTPNRDIFSRLERMLSVENPRETIALKTLLHVLRSDQTATLSQVTSLYHRLPTCFSTDTTVQHAMIQWLSQCKEDTASDILMRIYLQLGDSVYVSDKQSFYTLGAAVKAFQHQEPDFTYSLNFQRVSSKLMRHAIYLDHFHLALHVLKIFRAFRERSELPNTDSYLASLFEQLHRVADLPRKTMSFVSLLRRESMHPPDRKRKHKHTDPDPDGDAHRSILFRAMCKQSAFRLRLPRTVEHLESDCRAIRELFVRLSQDTLGTPNLFEPVMFILASANKKHKTPAIHDLMQFVYDKYRSMKTFWLSPQFLRRMVVAWRNDGLDSLNSTNDFAIDIILRDWRQQHGQLDSSTLFGLMEKYARIGNVARVEQYGLEYISTFDHRDPDRVWPLVYVHAIRRQPQQARVWFDRLRHQEGVVPNQRLWATLIFAYQRSNLLSEALNAYKELRVSGVRPDNYILGSLAFLLSEHGDIQGTAEILDIAKEEKITPSTILLSAQILACVNADDMLAAKLALTEAVAAVKAGTATGPLTVCYNTIMTAHAVRRQPADAIAIYRKMTENQIPLDNNSYGALMLSLCMHREPHKAYKILKVMKSTWKSQPEAFHYAICMSGFLATGQVREALLAYQHMKDAGIASTSNTRAVYFRAKVMAICEADTVVDDVGSVESAVIGLLEEMDKAPQAKVTKEPAARWAREVLGTPVYLANIDGLVTLLGHGQLAGVVRRILEDYLKRGLSTNPSGAPFKVIEALMVAHIRSDETSGIEDLWSMARRLAEKYRLPAYHNLELGHDQAEADESKMEHTAARSCVSPKNRSVLSRSLSYYMASLFQSTRLDARVSGHVSESTALAKMAEAIESVTSVGFALDNRTTNVYVRFLCRTSPPRTLLAFCFAEQHLIQSWAGWTTPPGKTLFYSSSKVKRSAVVEGLQRINARYLSPGEMMLQYRTAVYLRSALDNLRQWDAVDGGGLLRACKNGDTEARTKLDREVGSVQLLRQYAPRTLQAVLDMPRVSDTLQQTVLRSEET